MIYVIERIFMNVLAVRSLNSTTFGWDRYDLAVFLIDYDGSCKHGGVILFIGLSIILLLKVSGVSIFVLLKFTYEKNTCGVDAMLYADSERSVAY